MLAQQIVAEVAAQDWPEDELFDRLRRAWPFRELTREDFDAVVRMLAEGFATRRGRRGALIHHDAVNGMLRGRRGARLTALTSGGTIPDTADYQVLLEPENHVIGTVNEDFAVESMAGDIFQLGNASYRILRVERGTVRVEDAHGQPPTIPFWLGEAPGRSDELSASVSRLRDDVAARLRGDPSGEDVRRLAGRGDRRRRAGGRAVASNISPPPLAALGCLPTQETIVLERFFDEAGGMQLVIHSPFGSRINRAWGLALRKRFCRKFNFELQAAATEDNIVLSLTTAHSFELGDVARYLHSASVRPLLIQAMLDAPMFTTRWRWVAGVSLALPRFRGGKKVPPQFLRMQAEDLIAAVFPDQIACAENLVGEREVPDHPLVNQAIYDCLHEAMDIEGLERLLTRLEAGEIRVVSCDLTQPSPLALEVLSARPYAYLDDAPLEERRTQAVMARRWQDPQERLRSWPARSGGDRAGALGGLARPGQRRGAARRVAVARLPDRGGGAGAPAWSGWLAALAGEKRVAALTAGQATLWIPAERLAQFRALWPEAQLEPEIAAPADQARTTGPRSRRWPKSCAAGSKVWARHPDCAGGTAWARARTQRPRALVALEAEGAILRGRFIPGVNDEQWCDRRLLARIHRYTIESPARGDRAGRRARFPALPVRLAACRRGDAAGGAGRAPPAFWLSWRGSKRRPARGKPRSCRPASRATNRPGSTPSVSPGASAWARLTPPAGAATRVRVGGARDADRPARAPACPALDVARARQTALRAQVRARRPCWIASPRRARCSSRNSPTAARLLRAEVEEALGELVALGLVTSDSFAGLRAPAGAVGPAKAARRREAARPGAAFRHRERRPLGARPAGTEAAPPGRRGTTRSSMWRGPFCAATASCSGVCWRARQAGCRRGAICLRVYRRLEARGEIRGGRFVAGFSGEQFALPEAVGLMREIRRRPASGQWVSLSGADPLNLVGVLTPGARLAALTGNRVVFRDGVPVAALSGGKTQFLSDCGDSDQWEAEKRLVRSSARGLLAELA